MKTIALRFIRDLMPFLLLFLFFYGSKQLMPYILFGTFFLFMIAFRVIETVKYVKTGKVPESVHYTEMKFSYLSLESFKQQDIFRNILLLFQNTGKSIVNGFIFFFNGCIVIGNI
ncbi:hypothetical protein EMN47_07935 [Prolixibacteraceae bacterium JC049]|nr:hypothetical protein [Prolixibacteraceae bacterium JC049]